MSNDACPRCPKLANEVTALREELDELKTAVRAARDHLSLAVLPGIDCKERLRLMRELRKAVGGG